MNFSAVILAGGKSSRMGCDKAFLEIGGQSLLARQIELVRDAGADEVFVSGREEVTYSQFGCVVLRDKFPDAGPLAGIERALAAASASLLLVLAVDLPAMNAGLLRQLMTQCSEAVGVVPTFSGHVEPLAAVYPKAALQTARNQLERGEFVAQAFARSCAHAGLVHWVELEANSAPFFANLNSPADLPCLT